MKFKFRTLVNRHHRQIYALALRMLANKAEAEDATQEVFERLWANITPLAEQDAGPWLHRVTHNYCIDQLRKRKPSEELVDTLVDSATQTPDSASQQQQLSGWLNKAIAQLKEPYKTLIVLFDLQQKSVREVADSMSMQENHVKVSIHRARKQLRAILQGVEL